MRKIVRLIAAVAVAVGFVVAADAPKKDLVETAVEAGSFRTLAIALKEAGLIETLKGKGPFTVFAPSDDAFKKIPAETLQALLKDRKTLTAVLTYHVVAGELKAADVAKLKRAKTVEGDAVTIAVVDSKVKLNGTATVVKTDILCTNGVIHVIDTVLMPPKK